MRRLGRILAVEDLVWAGWLAILRPASGGLFLEGGGVSGFLILAATGFWSAALLGERGQARRTGGPLLMSLGMCAIMIDAGLKQIGAPIELRIAHTIAVVVLGAAATWQHQATRGGAWLYAPRWLRRALSWPFVMVLADMFSGMLEALAAPKAWTSGWSGEQSFTLGFVFAVTLPVIFAFFVVAPRKAVCPEVHVTTTTWVLRYLWAVATALFGTLVLGPLAAS